MLDLILAEGLAGKTVLDVGCGQGWLAFMVASDARWVVGLDCDEDAITQATLAAKERGIANVEFRAADAESTDYRGLGHPIEMVVAHLCMSDRIIARAAEALPPGGTLLFAAFHTDQWKETGKVSRFAYHEDQIRQVLETAGFTVEHLEVECRVRQFASKADALKAVKDVRSKWETDGRLANYLAYLEDGGRELTRSHLLVKARRQ